jgi:hypothetical protein
MYNEGAAGNFSGTVIYSAIEDNATLHVVRLRDGDVKYAASVLNSDNDYETNVNDMLTLVSDMMYLYKIYPTARKLTKAENNNTVTGKKTALGTVLGEVVVTTSRPIQPSSLYYTTSTTGGNYVSGSAGSGGGGGHATLVNTPTPPPDHSTRTCTQALQWKWKSKSFDDDGISQDRKKSKECNFWKHKNKSGWHS